MNREERKRLHATLSEEDTQDLQVEVNDRSKRLHVEVVEKDKEELHVEIYEKDKEVLHTEMDSETLDAKDKERLHVDIDEKDKERLHGEIDEKDKERSHTDMGEDYSGRLHVEIKEESRQDKRLQLHVSSLMLASHSEYFMSLFCNGMSEFSSKIEVIQVTEEGNLSCFV